MKGLRTTLVSLIVSASAIPVFAYVTARTVSTTNTVVQEKWGPNAFPLKWQMNPTIGTNVSGTSAQVESIFQQSFAAWQALTTASISFSESSQTSAGVVPGYDGVNLITTNVTPDEFGSSALGLTLVFAFNQGGPGIVDQLGRPVDFPGEILEADIMFNPTVAFSTSTPAAANMIDLQSVATHEVGHFLGLDHTGSLSATMFPYLTQGATYARTLSTDDIAGVSTIYPTAAFLSKGTIGGTVRTTGNTPVYGAIVTAVNATGQPVASAITDPNGQYTIAGLDAGSYSVYAEPMDQPITIGNVPTLTRIYPGATVLTNFTTRFR